MGTRLPLRLEDNYNTASKVYITLTPSPPRQAAESTIARSVLASVSGSMMYSPRDRQSDAASVGCCVFLRRPSTLSRLGYRALTLEDSSDGEESAVKLVVGKERRVFLVDRFVLEKEPLRVLMEMVARDGRQGRGSRRKGAIFVDVDHILFEHMLWLVYNDSSSSSSSSSLLQLNLKEIIDFYSQEN
ncbi:unnamed protein product [Musa hybrid cultivar]